MLQLYDYFLCMVKKIKNQNNMAWVQTYILK